MAELKTCFKKVDYDLGGLLHYIEIGDIGLPDIQRPFVWSQRLLAGLLTGSIYGLMCVGLALIFGVMRVINFAQGQIPYLLSGGFLGLGLVVTGATLLFLSTIRSERQLMTDRYDEMARLLAPYRGAVTCVGVGEPPAHAVAALSPAS